MPEKAKTPEVLPAANQQQQPSGSTEYGVKNFDKSSGDLGKAQVQAAIDKENAQGFVGVGTDPTPNENYTATHNDAPTPETDAAMAAKARAASGIGVPVVSETKEADNG